MEFVDSRGGVEGGETVSNDIGWWMIGEGRGEREEGRKRSPD